LFTDTHCHLSLVADRGENLAELIQSMDERGYRFVLDIGTKPGDLAKRMERINENGAPTFIHFTAGLWPDAGVIADRFDSMKILESDIDKMLDLPSGFAALGECGLDRYWNGSQALEREAGSGEDGPGTTDTAGEEELFSMQLELAKKKSLPVIIHSREAFDATLGCVRNGGWDSGVIHCFSYGTEEARAFIDRGWYISFPGNITWGKREADRDRIASLLRYVPRDRLLLETDAPYLTPAPHRGKTNTPLFIEHTYAHAAQAIGLDVASLAELVFANARELFSRKG